MKRLSIFLILSIIVLVFVLPIKPITSQEGDPSADYGITANQLVAQGFLEEAYELLTEGIKKYPDNITLILSRARLLFMLWRYEEAIEDYNTLIKINPLDDYLYVERGECYVYLGEFGEALDNFDIAIELSSAYSGKDKTPTYYLAYFYRSCVYYIMKMYGYIDSNKYKKDMEIALEHLSDAELYDKIASFIGLNRNDALRRLDLAYENTTKANEITGYQDPEILYTLAEITFQQALDYETGKINIFYIEQALNIMHRIIMLQDYLMIERNGYYLYRGRKMQETLNNAVEESS